MMLILRITVYVLLNIFIDQVECNLEMTTHTSSIISSPSTQKGRNVTTKRISDGNQGLPSEPPGGIHLDLPMRNTSKYKGDTIRIKCEITGDPLPTYFWFKNSRAMQEVENEDPRYDAKPTVWGSRLRIKNLKESDTAMYRCEGVNKWGTQSTEAALIIIPGVNPNANSDRNKDNSMDYPDFGGDEDEDLDPIEYHPDYNPPHSGDPVLTNPDQSLPGMATGWNGGVKPGSGAGFCQIYRGLACSKHISNKNIFVMDKEQQNRMEKTMTAALATIASANVISEECREYAIPTLCYNAFPLCDEEVLGTSPPKPRFLCKDECLALESSLCKTEFDMARNHPLLNNNVVLPNCDELPEANSPEGRNCMRIGLLPARHAPTTTHKAVCYNETGQSYRGTVHTTVSGYTCQRWTLANHYHNMAQHPELGEHNYCRNPDGSESGPWCYTTDSNVRKEICQVPKCVVPAEKKVSEIVMILVPSIAVPVGLALLLLAVCMCRRNKSAGNMGKPTGTTKNGTASHVEMNALLAKQQIRAREFPISSIRFIQEMGEGTFGKVYRGELLGYYSDNTITNVVIKTVKPGADLKSQQDFRKEVEVMTDMKHPNIICLLGVCLKEHPNCMLFEFLCNGDLHNYLNIHSPRNDIIYSEKDGHMVNMLGYHELLHIATQVASGMEYLASHRFVHRDLAARNALVGENCTVKISDFGLARDVYSEDYYRVQNNGLLPVRWMPPEAIVYGSLTVESDVWSYGVLLWEIFSYGLKPYYGFTNEEVINMIRARQILPCPEDCPPLIYAMMIECWHEKPIRRPTFNEIHKRLIQWKADAIMNQQPSMINYGQIQGGVVPPPSHSSNTSGQSHVGNGGPPSHHSSTGPSNNTATTCLTGSSHTPPTQQMAYSPYPIPQQHYHHTADNNGVGMRGIPPYQPMSMPYPPPNSIPGGNVMYRPIYPGLYKKPTPPGSLSGTSGKSSSVHSSLSPASSVVSNCKVSSNHSGSMMGGGCGHPPQYGFSPVPNGHYSALPEIDYHNSKFDSSFKPSSNDSGMYIPDIRTSEI